MGRLFCERHPRVWNRSAAWDLCQNQGRIRPPAPRLFAGRPRVLSTGGIRQAEMNTTVVLCTCNRCESLAKALASAARLQLPESVDWEVLVVDNNSSDRTREVVQEYCGRFPGRFRYLFEPRQGKSHALNAGIREARGEIIAFIDDDVVVEPTWLSNLTAGLHDGQWAGAGGRILPQAPFEPPDWIPLQDRYALAPLALFDPDLAAGQLYRTAVRHQHGFP